MKLFLQGVVHAFTACGRFFRRPVEKDIPSLSPAEVEATSERFVTGLDRSRLGDFVVPMDALLAMDIFYRTSVHVWAASYPEAYEAMSIANQVASRKANDACYSAAVEWRDVVAELLFWWDTADDSPGIHNAIRESVSVGLDRLNTITSHPEMHGYFAAGIWDVPFIERCRADGVDSDLASTVLAPVGN